MDLDPEAPAAITNALLTNILDRMVYLEALTANHMAEIQTLTQTITEQHTQIASLRVSQGKDSEPQIADPEPFTGNRLHLSNFLAKCRLKFAGQPSKFQKELPKIYYAGSRLGDPAFSWFQPLLSIAEDREKPNPPEFASFETFATALTAVYGDPNLATSSVRAIKALKHTGSAAHYIAEFQRLRQYIPWNESALADQFYDGLKSTIKDDIAHTGRPATLLELQTLATRLDARLYERFLEKRQETPASTQPRNLPPKPTPMVRTSSPMPSSLAPTLPRTPSPSVGTPAFTPDGTIPMELDTYGRWRLPAEEKLRRKQLRLCDYCGSGQHNVFNCPDKPAPSQPKLPRFARQAEISFEITSPEDPPKDNTQE
jgi:hypothetical protein